jgi:hypothetical protein
MAGIAALTQEFLHHATAVLDPSTGQAERRQSDLWLGAFQLSAEAWQVVESVLRAPGVPDNVLFLAAQTLNRKVRYDAEQLRGDWTQVRASLFVLIEAHAARPVVSTQLALGLVACAVQMDSWKVRARALGGGRRSEAATGRTDEGTREGGRARSRTWCEAWKPRWCVSGATLRWSGARTDFRVCRRGPCSRCCSSFPRRWTSPHWT